MCQHNPKGLQQHAYHQNMLPKTLEPKIYFIFQKSNTLNKMQKIIRCINYCAADRGTTGM